MFGFLRRLLGRSGPPADGAEAAVSDALFAGFSEKERRELVNWCSVTRDRGKWPARLAGRVTAAQYSRLERITDLMEEADGTSGEAAVALYQQVRALAPWDEVCVMSIGVEHAQAGDYAEAVRWLETALRMNPASERVRDNLEAARAARGD